MTRFSDNIYSGFQAATSAASSKSMVVLRKVHNFVGNSTTTAVTKTGTFPPNTQNLTARLFVIQNATSATVSDKITVSAGGTNLITIDQFGSAGGVAGDTKAGFARFTYIASACAAPPVPATGQVNGGEIPYSVTFVPVSADNQGSYQLELTFNRADTNTLGTTQ